MGLNEFRWPKVIQFVNHMIPLLMWNNWHWFLWTYIIKDGRFLFKKDFHCNWTSFINASSSSARWADAFYKSKFPSVCLSVCSLLRYRLNVFLPQLPKVGCPIFLEIRNPSGKVMGRSGLRFKHFCLKIVKNRRAKKNSFFALISPYKTWWKPRFPMD